MKRTVLELLLVACVAMPLGACSNGGSPQSGGAAGAAGGGAGAGTAGASGAAGTMSGPGGASGKAGGGAAGSVGASGAGVAGAGAAGAMGAAGAAGAGAAGAAGTAGAGGTSVDGSADTGTSTSTKVFTTVAKLMVVGSSNEIGTCWRAYLWQDLHTAGITNFDFVGDQNGGPSCTVVGWNDTELQAMSGINITDLPASTYNKWFADHPPDVILMHFGGADILANKPVDGVMKAYGTALAQARLVNPKVILLIAQHTPEGKDAIVTLNADIATWAPQNSTPDSPVIAVDLYTGMLATDFSDGVHLNQSGSMKVADRWLAALKPFFKP